MLVDQADRSTAGLAYAAGAFDAETMARTAGHLRTTLETVTRDPATTVGEVPLLAPHEQRQALHLWNATSVPFDRDATVHGLFEHSADTTPVVVAAEIDEATLTYGELEARANRVAWRLRELGARPGVRIGVLLDRSLEMPVALLGVLKSGAAYVPLEPDLPRERIALTLADAGAEVVVTVDAHRDLLPTGDAAPEVVALDGGASALEGVSTDRPPPLAEAGDVAYVLFTSGSTGRPKAAQIEHRGVVNLVTWIADRCALGPDDRVMLKTPYSHDISVPEFFVTFAVGGRLVIAPPDAHRDPGDLIALVDRAGVTVIHFVPTMLREFVADPAVATCTSLRHVFVGGEALTRDLAEHFSATLDATLHNVYGPTEATDYTTSWEVRPDAAAIAPIGTPIANMRTYVLDAALRPLPVGVPGELCVAGAGVGRGYLNRPELTAERFVPDPFDPDGGRLYRSGDICVRRADGTLEFVRRDDGQVKIRGHRVELGEVEATLLGHAGVAEAGVLVREDEPGLRRLVAYVVPAPGAAPTVSELRTWCADRVPEYAVPSAFVTLDGLPHTPSGKLDRRALPAPDLDRPELATAFVAPRTDADRTLCDIWASVLGLGRVGIHDDFFELGGDSILAIRIASRAKRAGLPLAVRDLFAHGTVAGLVTALAERRSGGGEDDEAGRLRSAPLSPVGWLDEARLDRLTTARPGLEDAYPLTPMQSGMLFHTLAAPGAGDYVEQIVVTVEADDARLVEEAWLATLASHAALRTSVTTEIDDRPLALVHPEIEPDVRWRDWRGAGRERRRELLEELLAADRREDFDPLRPPLWRLILARVEDRRWICVWSHHHLLLDGWSVKRLLSDLPDVAERVAGAPARRRPRRPGRGRSATSSRGSSAWTTPRRSSSGPRSSTACARAPSRRSPRRRRAAVSGARDGSWSAPASTRSRAGRG